MVLNSGKLQIFMENLKMSVWHFSFIKDNNELDRLIIVSTLKNIA